MKHRLHVFLNGSRNSKMERFKFVTVNPAKPGIEQLREHAEMPSLRLQHLLLNQTLHWKKSGSK